MDIPIGRLQPETEVLLRFACEQLNLSGDGRRIVFDISHFEETLVDPRCVESLDSQLLR
jgi:hypothetical protein